MAKSAIQAVFMVELSNHDKELLKRFMKGIFNSRPSLPRYRSTWDVDKLFSVLASWGLPEQLSYHRLTIKTAVMLLILSGRRAGCIVSINLSDVIINNDVLTIRISSLTKTTVPGKHVPDIILKGFPDKKLCLLESLKEYMKKSAEHRKSDKLLVSYVWPFKGISRDTLGRWTKSVMTEAGIDMNIFKPHSIRSAVVSKAITKEVSLATIMSTIGWRQASTIGKYYNKQISGECEMANALLEDRQ